MTELPPTKPLKRPLGNFDLGTFFVFKNFEFSDGSFKDKLFIVLGVDGSNCLAAITTSKEKPPYRVKSPGFNSCGSSYFVPQTDKILESGGGFDLDTWVDLSKVYPSTEQRLSDHYANRVIHILGKLKSESLLQLMEGAINSDDLSGTEIDVIKANMDVLRSRPNPTSA